MLDTEKTDLKETLLLTVPKRRSCPMPWRSTRGSTSIGQKAAGGRGGMVTACLVFCVGRKREGKVGK